MSPSTDKDESQPENVGKIMGEMESDLKRKIVRFNDLARCGAEIWIEYEGKLYRLQSTRQGKLVLTK